MEIRISPLALDFSVGKGPDGARYGIGIGSSSEIDIFKGLGNKASHMWVVASGGNRCSIDVGVVAACQVKLQRHLRGKVEIGVECACTVARSHRLGSGEFPDVVRTGALSVQAFLDTVAFCSNLREHQVDFSHDSCDIKPAGVADTASLLGVVQPWAYGRKSRASLAAIVSSGTCNSTKGKKGRKERTDEAHFVRYRIVSCQGRIRIGDLSIT